MGWLRVRDKHPDDIGATLRVLMSTIGLVRAGWLLLVTGALGGLTTVDNPLQAGACPTGYCRILILPIEPTSPW